MQKIEYRRLTHQALLQAQQHLRSDDEASLRSAALQLRMAIEGLTYDRMQVYSDEIAPEHYQTWQPRRVMELLLEIDAGADKDVSLSIGLEETYGVPAMEMHFLGTEKVLGIATIKKHYDALGAALHMPTIKQMREGKHLDSARLRARCIAIAALVERILASPVSNLHFAAFSETVCCFCGKTMHKRAPLGSESLTAKCFDCGGLYVLTNVSDKVRWEPQRTNISCPTRGCEHVFVVGDHRFALGFGLICPRCGGGWRIRYAVVPDVDPASNE